MLTSVPSKRTRGNNYMSNFKERLDALSPARLRGVRRGIEKESLRSQLSGSQSARVFSMFAGRLTIVS